MEKSLMILLLAMLATSTNGLGEFVARCPATHMAPDDPIVAPGVPGGSHMHTFFGAIGVNAHSTVDSILHSATNCDPPNDHSSYWVPTLRRNSQIDPNTCNPIPEFIMPDRATFYYLTHDYPENENPIPLGLAMIAKGNYKYSCQGGGPSGPDMVDCGTNPLELLINFPDCLIDNVTLDSPDHISHTAYSIANKCPAGHPLKIPQLQFKLRYPVSGGPGYTLSSGAATTAHADFINGWIPEAMLNRVNECSRADVKCPENIPSDTEIPVNF